MAIEWREVIPRAAQIVQEYDTLVTLRQLHYRLVSEAVGGYVNTESAYKGLSSKTAELRRQRRFPSLADLTRAIEVQPSWDSPQAILNAVASQYQRDHTLGQEVVPLIIVEKATLVAQVSSWFGDYGIAIAPLRGYSSESFDSVVRRSFDQEREYRVIYVGDFDPSGEDIERHAQEEIGYDISDWEKVAVTPDTVDDYNLPEAPGKPSDARAGGFVARHGRLVQVEVEALAPQDLQALIQGSVDRTWDAEAYDEVLVQENEEKARLQELADNFE